MPLHTRPPLGRVLLVDDAPATNYLTKLLLTRLGVAGQLLVAGNDAQALLTLDQACTAPVNAACPRLFLLDMNIPVLDGIAFLAACVPLA